MSIFLFNITVLMSFLFSQQLAWLIIMSSVDHHQLMTLNIKQNDSLLQLTMQVVMKRKNKSCCLKQIMEMFSHLVYET
jgi:hypothetical protein